MTSLLVMSSRYGFCTSREGGWWTYVTCRVTAHGHVCTVYQQTAVECLNSVRGEPLLIDKLRMSALTSGFGLSQAALVCV